MLNLHYDFIMYRLIQYPISSLNRDKNTLTMAAGAVIMNKGKVLLVREHEDALFSFPGGTVESNESIDQTVIREVKEELNLDIKLMGNPYIFEFEREFRGKVEIVILFHYMATDIKGKLQLGSDAKELIWLGPKDDFSKCYPNVEFAVKYFSESV